VYPDVVTVKVWTAEPFCPIDPVKVSVTRVAVVVVVVGDVVESAPHPLAAHNPARSTINRSRRSVCRIIGLSL
jgi:hypothetical protein